MCVCVYVYVEMDYFKSRELFLLLVVGMPSSSACRQHLSTAFPDGAMSQSLVFTPETCAVCFTKNTHTRAYIRIYKNVNVHIYD